MRARDVSQKSNVNLCFVDLRKAFDSEWRKGLFYKLLTYGIGGMFNYVITTMHKKANFCLKLNE